MRDAPDDQEEVYTVLEGSATLEVGGESHALERGTFARVGAAEKRKIVTTDEAVTLLIIGGTPGAAYEAPGWSEIGGALPG